MSMPLNPRSLTSSTRQLGTSGSFLCNKVSADSKLSTCSPTVLKRNLIEDRTDGSSSTTKTMEAVVMLDSRHLLAGGTKTQHQWENSARPRAALRGFQQVTG